MVRIIGKRIGAAVVCVLCVAGVARAGEISGSFSGVAINSTLGSSRDGSNFNGTPITGTFDLQASNPEIRSMQPYYAYYRDVSSTLTFNILGGPRPGTYSFPFADGNTDSAFVTGSEQTVMIRGFQSDGGFQVYNQAEVSLSGFNLFDLADSTNFNPAAVIDSSLPNSFAFLSLRGDLSATVLFTSLTVNVPSQVPEPATLTVLLSGLAGLAAMRHRRTSLRR